MERLFAAALVAGGMLAGSVSTAEAATLTYSTTDPYAGSVNGILGLDVGGQLYNVSFMYGSYDAVYSTPLAFSNAADIMDAINAELYTACAPVGCNIARPLGVPADYRVPVSQIIASEISYYTAMIEASTGLWLRQSSPPGPFTISTSTQTMWAQISPIPLPAGAWLLLSALGGLGFFGWRRRKAVAA